MVSVPISKLKTVSDEVEDEGLFLTHNHSYKTHLAYCSCSVSTQQIPHVCSTGLDEHLRFRHLANCNQVMAITSRISDVFTSFITFNLFLKTFNIFR